MLKHQIFKDIKVNQNKYAQYKQSHQTWDPGLGVLHFLMLQTVLNEKLTLPHFGHVQSLSRVASIRKVGMGTIILCQFPFQHKLT